ncbi:MAG: DsrE family protein [Flavobacteriaceae bacterium]
MQNNFSFLFLFLAIFYTSMVAAQTKSKGPVISEFGEVFAIENATFPLDTTKEYKAVFDIMTSPESHQELNRSMETAARFLNMHAQAGVPVSNLKAAMVVHNEASKDVITNEAYQKRYNTNNPNLELIQALLKADVQVVFCGQSSAARNFPKEDLIPGVQLALSAMTALIQFQNQEYRLIKF